MEYSPVIPASGLAGWQFLSRTLPSQMQAFSESASYQREVSYFEKQISQIGSAKELVEDVRLLRIALTAFGLEDDIPNKYLIRKVLEDGVVNPEALANRFSDKRYFELSRAFGFGKQEQVQTSSAEFVDQVISSFKERSFEAAIGEKDETMRLAISFEREITKVMNASSTDLGAWLSVLGNPPLKAVFERALRIPASYGNSDLDSQVNFLKSRFNSVTGETEFSALASKSNSDRILQNFLLFSEIAETSFSRSANTALQLLQGVGGLRV